MTIWPATPMVIDRGEADLWRRVSGNGDEQAP